MRVPSGDPRRTAVRERTSRDSRCRRCEKGHSGPCCEGEDERDDEGKADHLSDCAVPDMDLRFGCSVRALGCAADGSRLL